MRFLILKKKNIIKCVAVLFFILTLTFFVSFSTKIIERRYMYPLKYEAEICHYADMYGLERELVFSVVNVESGFDKNAVSKRGAKGLMQLTDGTAEYVSKKCQLENYSIFNENDNLNLGCYYLKYLIDKFKDIFTALSAYNAGEGKVKEWLKDERYSKTGENLINTPYNETNEYVKKIYKSLDKYRKLYGNILDKK